MEGSEQVAHSQDTSLLLGSGMVESVNKLVEAQLKGAGMHWQRGTSILCSCCATPSATSAGRRPSRPVSPSTRQCGGTGEHRSEERRVGKECRSRWWSYH